MRIKATNTASHFVRFFETDWPDAYFQVHSFMAGEYLFYIDDTFYRVLKSYQDQDDGKWAFQTVSPMEAADWLLNARLHPSDLISQVLANEFAELTFGKFRPISKLATVELIRESSEVEVEAKQPGELSRPDAVESAESDEDQPSNVTSKVAPTVLSYTENLKTEWLLESRILIKQYESNTKPTRELVKRVRNWYTRDWTRPPSAGLPWWKRFSLDDQQELLSLRNRFLEIWKK